MKIMSKYIMEMKKMFPESKVTWEVIKVINKYMIVTAQPVDREVYLRHTKDSVTWSYNSYYKKAMCTILLR